jgi:enterochelin esterase-like enzyme
MPGWETFDAFLMDAQAAPPADRQALVDALLEERPAWPWIENRRATFIYADKRGAERVAVNLDRVKGDPPFEPMEPLAGTTLFYRTLEFEMDDLLDYVLAVNDPMTPLRTERDIAGRVRRFWRMDPHNPAGMQAATADVSVLRMPNARPFPDWNQMGGVPRGSTVEHKISSTNLGVRDRKVWVHLPPNYHESSLTYPLVVLQDGQWMNGPLQVPAMADALLKHGRMAPAIIAMIQSGSQTERIREYVTSEKYYPFLMTELLPFLQSNYRVDATQLILGGASAGAIAAADAALRNPGVVHGLLMMSPPLGKGAAADVLTRYPSRFRDAKLLPRRVFQSVGRYEVSSRFRLPAIVLADILDDRTDIEYDFVETGSGHGLVAFRSVLPEALAWTVPGWASL